MVERMVEPEWVFPFSGMNIGDSFFIPTLRPAEMLYAVDRQSKELKIRVKAYVASKEGYIGIRVWRIT